MEVHQLRYFVAVARNGTFTRASEVEHVAQPSLSQQILKLEAELGARLFDRLPRSARLTDFGRAFLPKAERILLELNEAKVEMLEMAGDERGALTLGVIPTIASYFLPPVLTRFSKRYRDLAIRVIEDITPVLLERMREGAIGMALVALPVQGDDWSSMELFEEGFFAALPAKHPKARQKEIQMSDLQDDPFLLLKEGHCFRDSMISACDESGIKPRIVFESGQFATILGMVSAGMGVSAVPEMAVRAVPGCRFVRIAGKHNSRKIGLVKLRRHFATRAEQVFLRHVEQSCNSGPKAHSVNARTALLSKLG
jgi:LysR family hydrogen peroxide-inducible transcriptional activator